MKKRMILLFVLVVIIVNSYFAFSAGLCGSCAGWLDCQSISANSCGEDGKCGGLMAFCLAGVDYMCCNSKCGFPSYCGGGGAICTDRTQCNSVYSECFGGHCMMVIPLGSYTSLYFQICASGANPAPGGICGDAGAVCTAHKTCMSDLKCGFEYKSGSKKCGGVLASCADGERCMVGLTCGTWLDGRFCGGVGSTCASDTDCVYDVMCGGGYCGGLGAQCSADNQCANGVKCGGGVCGGKGALCQYPDNSKCMPNLKCGNSDPNQCGGLGALCSVNANCMNNYKCLGGSCILGDCASDADCPQGKVCRSAACVDDTSPPQDRTAPTITISKPLNNQVLIAGTTFVLIEIKTLNENADCRYSTSDMNFNFNNGVPFASTGVKVHTFTYTPVENGRSYIFYYKCRDKATPPNTNAQSVSHTFSVASPAPGACASDADCPAGQKCSAGMCTAVTGCTNDVECSQGQKCSNGKCIPITDYCVSDFDCTTGKICDAVKSQCIPGCKATKSCQQGKVCEINPPVEIGTCKTVADSACSSDTDCISGYECKSSICKQSGAPPEEPPEPGTCAQDTDCIVAHEQCIAGLCLNPKLKSCAELNGVTCKKDDKCVVGTSTLTPGVIVETASTNYCCYPKTAGEEVSCVPTAKVFEPSAGGEVFVKKGKCVNGQRKVEQCNAKPDGTIDLSSGSCSVKRSEPCTDVQRAQTVVPFFGFYAGFIAVLIIGMFYMLGSRRFKLSKKSIF